MMKNILLNRIFIALTLLGLALFLPGCRWGGAVRETGGEDVNRCARDVLGDFAEIDVDPDYWLGFYGGKKNDIHGPSRCNGTRRWWFGPTCRNDLHSRHGYEYHRQGIQRLRHDGRNYIIVSSSVQHWGIGDIQGGVEIARIFSKYDAAGSMGPNMGVNGTTNGMPPSPSCENPDRGDKTIGYTYPGTGHHNHAGGIDVLGRYVVVPFTTKHQIPSERARAHLRILDLDDIESPVWSDPFVRFTSGRSSGCSVVDNNDAFCAGSASITKLSTGHYLLLAWGHGAREADMWLSQEPEVLSFSPDDWNEYGTLTTEGIEGWSGYQNVNLVTQCDGRMFLIGTGGGEEASIYELSFKYDEATERREPVISDQLARRTFECDTNDKGWSTQYCDFGAGAGAYIDFYGRLHMYGVERWADVRVEDDYNERGGAWVVGFREFSR